MKLLLSIYICFLMLSPCDSQELRLFVATNSSAFNGDYTGKFGEELVIDIYLENVGNQDLSVITSPHRVINLNSLKIGYWYDRDAYDGRLVVPNQYELKPVIVPPGALVLVDKLRFPVTAIKQLNTSERVTLSVSYDIDESVGPLMHVWTGEINENVVLK